MDLRGWGVGMESPQRQRQASSLCSNYHFPCSAIDMGHFYLCFFFFNKFSLKDNIHREECTDQKNSAG